MQTKAKHFGFFCH